ncbi:MFS general substrate transporter [Patellaria atrata CBS 101060]|uniref:MFS general substrate transporter n=1 Tax=Patellaria atrata CBS 101060 TaxID=1346257 RepID=A0A9P4SGK6_9PEZI|nr:MFS general substrate transporter [Patellaria atrata CBS 101060]
MSENGHYMLSSTAYCCVALHFLLGVVENIPIAPLLVLYERSICLQYYLKHDPSAIHGTRIEHDLCKISTIQKELAVVKGWKSFFDTLPVLLIGIIIGRYGDRYGRKLAMTISISGVIASFTVVAVVCAFPFHIPTRYVWLSSICLLFGGGLYPATSLMWAIASQSVVEEHRSNVFYLVFSAFYVGELISSFIASLTTDISPWIPYASAVIALLLCLLVLTLMPTDSHVIAKRIPSQDIQSQLMEESNALLSESVSNLSGRGHVEDPPTSMDMGSPVGIAVTDSISSKKETRLLNVLSNSSLLAIIPAFLVCALRYTMLNILMQYCYIRFDWKFSRTALFFSEAAIVNILLFSLILPNAVPWIKKRYNIPAKVFDRLTAEIFLCLLSSGAFALGISPGWQFIPIAVLIYTSGFGSRVTSLSLASYWISEASRAEFYAGISVLENIGHGVGDTMMQNIFAAVADRTDRWLATPFFLAAMLYASSAACIIVTSRQNKTDSHVD